MKSLHNLILALSAVALILSSTIPASAKSRKRHSKDNPFYEYNYKIWKLKKLIAKSGGKTTEDLKNDLEALKAKRKEAIHNMKAELIVRQTDLQQKLATMKAAQQQAADNLLTESESPKIANSIKPAAAPKTTTTVTPVTSPTPKAPENNQAATEQEYEKLAQQLDNKMKSLVEDDIKKGNPKSQTVADVEAELKTVEAKLKKIDKWAKQRYKPAKKKARTTVSKKTATQPKAKSYKSSSPKKKKAVTSKKKRSRKSKTTTKKKNN